MDSEAMYLASYLTPEITVIHKEGQQWYWPAFDEKLIQVFDWHRDIEIIMQHVKGSGACIQAGGATGVWPIKFASYFKHVFTFEPDRMNYECLFANIGVHNVSGRVYSFNTGLSDGDQLMEVQLDEIEAGNAGAKYLAPYGGESGSAISTVTIDEMMTTKLMRESSIDLIQLDVEGMELEALTGAHKTIKQHQPVIVIEEKPLPHMTRKHTAAREWLEGTHGYTEAAKVHRDVIFVPAERA